MAKGEACGKGASSPKSAVPKVLSRRKIILKDETCRQYIKIYEYSSINNIYNIIIFLCICFNVEILVLILANMKKNERSTSYNVEDGFVAGTTKPQVEEMGGAHEIHCPGDP